MAGRLQEAFIAETCKLLHCDRATLFLVDNATKVRYKSTKVRAVSGTLAHAAEDGRRVGSVRVRVG